MEHKVRHKGWNGEAKEDHTLDLDSEDIEGSQKIIDAYLENNMLEDDFDINLWDIIRSNDF